MATTRGGRTTGARDFRAHRRSLPSSGLLVDDSIGDVIDNNTTARKLPQPLVTSLQQPTDEVRAACLNPPASLALRHHGLQGGSDGGWQAHVLGVSRQALHLRLIGEVVMTVVPVSQPAGGGGVVVRSGASPASRP